jgi:hypothetical protein
MRCLYTAHLTKSGKFYVVFAVHFDITQQLNQQMHFIC